MGQHKFNPNCEAAKDGKLKPKKRPMSKKTARALVAAYFLSKTGSDKLIGVMGGRYL